MSNSEIKNVQLKEALEKYLRKAVELVYPEFTKLKYDSDLEAFVLLDKLKDQLEQIPEHRIVIDLMNKDEKISKHIDKMVGTSGQSTRFEIRRFLIQMIKGLCRAYEKRDSFDNELFDKLYHDFESFLYDDEISLVYVVPISNFKSTSLPLVLEGDLIIRTIKTSEKEHLGVDQFGIGSIEYHMTNHVIEHKFKETKYIDEPGKIDFGKRVRKNDPYQQIVKLISALHLFKQGNFQYKIVITKDAGDIQFFGTTITNFARVSGTGGSYSLEQGEIKEFKKFWKNLSGGGFLNFKPNGIAVRRFSGGVEKYDKEDQVIDFLIGFEALFFKQGETAEQTHKISVRVSRLLETEFEKRKTMFKEMKEIYKIRSEIVHGDEPSFSNSSFNNLNEVVVRAQELLRKSIRIFLDNEVDTQNKHNEFIIKLDLG